MNSKDLPIIVSREHLVFHWEYRDEDGNVVALVARYEEMNSLKKRYHQYRLGDKGQWIEGVATPSPLYGLELLSKVNSTQKVYIFEGEKCAAAAQHLGLPALTSMMGSSQAKYADWAILAKYRRVAEFVLIPDNDDPGYKYAETVFQEIQKACPNARVSVCQLPAKNKGDDFVDWVLLHSACQSQWDGLGPIDEPYSVYLQRAFEDYVNQHCIDGGEYFKEEVNAVPIFEHDPEPIELILSEVLPCPTETLPPVFVNWIRGLALQMQISEDSLVAPLLVYLGSLIGRKRGLRLRPGNGWIEYPNLWGMLIGRPAIMKSPAMKAVRGPLEMLAERASQEYKKALQQHEMDVEVWTIRKKAAQEVYKKAIKDSLEDSTSQKKPVQFHAEISPIKPKQKRYKTEDATTEKLGELLVDNPQGMLLFRDEIAGWLNSFEKNGREGDRQFFLESWSGNQEFDVDRISRGSLHIPALCLSIFGSIQPGPVSQYVRAAVQGGAGDDGFLQRFQIMVWPDAKSSWKLHEGISTMDLEVPIRRIFDCLDCLAFDSVGEPVILSFTKEAQVLFNKWQEEYETWLRSGGLPSHLEAHFTKYKKLLPALCLILEHIGQAAIGTHTKEITAETLESAKLWLSYFDSHARRVYDSGIHAVPKAANDLIMRLRKEEIPMPFTLRDVYYKKHWSGLANALQVKEVVGYLEEKNYLIAKLEKGSGRPLMKYWANPKLYEDTQ